MFISYLSCFKSARVIIEGAACTIYWPLKGLCKCDPGWNLEINCLVSNPQKDERSQMISAGGHRPKNTFLSHHFHVASKRVVKLKNWGRRGWFLSTCEDELLAFYSAVHLLYFLINATWGWKWTLFFAACNARAWMLCWPYSAWLPAQQKILFWLLSSLLAFLFQVLFLDTLTRCHAGLSICQSFVWQCEPDPLWFPRAWVLVG